MASVNLSKVGPQTEVRIRMEICSNWHLMQAALKRWREAQAGHDGEACLQAGRDYYYWRRALRTVLNVRRAIREDIRRQSA